MIKLNLQHQIPVSMQMDISTHHHPAVLGVGSCNLRDIMNRTGTKVGKLIKFNFKVNIPQKQKNLFSSLTDNVS